jgi:hypothetical protein
MRLNNRSLGSAMKKQALHRSNYILAIKPADTLLPHTDTKEKHL